MANEDKISHIMNDSAADELDVAEGVGPCSVPTDLLEAIARLEEPGIISGPPPEDFTNEVV